MDSSKIKIADRSSALVKAFTGEFPTLNGNNFFTGEFPPERTFHGGQMGMGAADQEDWETLWRLLGLPAPGPLPEGTFAQMFVDSVEGHHVKTSVRNVFKKDQQVSIEWDIVRTPAGDGEKRRVFFAVVLVPKTEECMSFYTYENRGDPACVSKPPSAPKM